MSSEEHEVPNSKPLVVRLLAAITTGALVALLSATPAIATDTIYHEGNSVKGGYYGSTQQPSLTGGRNASITSIATLRTQTTDNLNNVLFSVDASFGGAADLTHVRKNLTRERCRWIPITEPSPSGDLWITCKYRY